MYSFYGGKQGRTYHIVERYDSIYLDPEAYNDFDPNKQDYEQGEYFKYNEKFYKILTTEGSISDIDAALNDYKIVQIKGMVNCFSLGGSYTDVNYGEYVIIDTFLNEHHRNDEVNGLLYRRGLEYNQVGTTTRPIRQQYDSQEAYNADWYNYILHPGAGAVYIGQILGPQGLSPQLKGKKWSDIQPLIDQAGSGGEAGVVELNRHLGYQNGTFYDKTKVGWVNIKDADGDTVECYIGFDIPTTLFRFRAVDISPYGEQNIPHNITNPDLGNDPYSVTVNNTSGSAYPYKGYSNLVHLHKATGPSGDPTPHPFFYDYSIAIPKGIHGQDVTSIQVVTKQQGDNLPNDLTPGQYLKFNKKNYNRTDDMSQDISSDYFPYRIIDNISNVYTGLNDTWRSGSNTIGTIIPNSRDLNNKRVFICIKSGITRLTSQPQEGSWVVSAYASDLNGQQIQLQPGVIFKACTQNQANLQDTSEWLYTELAGTRYVNNLKIDYTYGQDSYLPINLPYCVFVASDGTVYATYTNNVFKPYPVGHIDTIRHITLNDGIFYGDTGRNVYTIGKIHYIEELKLKGDCIAAYYSDADYRNNFINDINHLENRDYWIEDGKIWINLGSLITGNHINGDYTLNQLLNSQAEGNIVDGLSGNQAGWIVTVTIDQDHVYQYAYDYNKTHRWTRPDNQVEVESHWYPIAGYDATLVQPQKTMIIDSANGNVPSTVAKHTDLSENGFWFVTSSGHNHN